MEVEIEFASFSSEDDFYCIANILSEKLNFRRLKKIEGLDAIVCKFVCGNFSFWLIWDDLVGNFLKTEKVIDSEKLNEVLKKVEMLMDLNKK